jgi:hypothetical protein
MASDIALSIADLVKDCKVPLERSGNAPIGYISGIVVSFGRVYCQMKAGCDAALETAAADTADDATDALSYYANKFGALGMDNSVPGSMSFGTCSFC